jgi:hypothetical protein
MQRPLDQISMIDLPKINDPRGNLTFIEGNRHIPFEIKRVFYIYDIPTAQDRGSHAHRTLHQFLVCLSGSFNVNLDDGYEKKVIRLNKPWQGLYVPPMIWASETNFDHGSICMVLASDVYNEADYYRDYEQFLAAVKEKGRS